MPPPTDLPIEEALPELLRALQASRSVVLQAPPGAGKTTVVPLALLDAPWLGDGCIIMLEPRRLAARAAAERMASVLGERVGETIGYRIRLESRVGPRTRVEVVTEGILTRMLQDDPSLDRHGCVILDEFHERSLQADLALALLLDARRAFRPDLRVLVMSATLDDARVAALLEAAPVVTARGRQYTVETSYIERPPDRRIAGAAAHAVRRELSAADGDILVFLPGAAEIKRTGEYLTDLPAEVRVHPLFGALPFAKQTAALSPGPPGTRRVVLSTDIAETSLTIPGVRSVIDSGLARTPLFDPEAGLSRLITVPISKASAAQRRGRAGREAPGHCLRLWTRAQQGARPEYATPEIVQADLAPLALELVCWGVSDPAVLDWLDSPHPDAFARALGLLRDLGAVTQRGSITEEGRHMASLGMHPRLGHMLLAAGRAGRGDLAIELAALLEERDLLPATSGHPPADIRLRLEALRRGSTSMGVHTARLHRARLRQKDIARRLARFPNNDIPEPPTTPTARRDDKDPPAGAVLALAYPERVAQRTGSRPGLFRARNGTHLELDPMDPLADHEYLSVAEAGGSGVHRRILLAAPLEPGDIEDLFADHLEQESIVTWDRSAERVQALRRTTFGAVVLRESADPDPDPERVTCSLMAEVIARELRPLPWDKASRQLQARILFLRERDPAWPDASDAGLTRTAQQCLKPYLMGMYRLEDLRRINMTEVLCHDVSRHMRRLLDDRAPTHLSVPSGSRIPIDYSDPRVPTLRVRLQEIFGWTTTPRINGVPVLLELLSPAQRPVQVTADLAGFWSTSYFDVRKDMRGRYPRHYWPEDPLNAAPTARAKPRKSRD